MQLWSGVRSRRSAESSVRRRRRPQRGAQIAENRDSPLWLHATILMIRALVSETCPGWEGNLEPDDGATLVSPLKGMNPLGRAAVDPTLAISITEG